MFSLFFHTDKAAMDTELTPLLPSDYFTFGCSASVPCFNDCCKNLNHFLTPYDVLRLKKHLNITSGDFIKTYASFHTGPESGLPVLTLTTSYASQYKCPFNTENGCSVYEDRPSSCRIYPLARLLTRSRETGRLTEYYYLIEEEHCKGFNEGKQWTYPEWIENQQLAPYHQLNDLLMDLIRLKNVFHPEPLNKDSKDIIKLALYDLDAFRTAIFEQHRFGENTEPAVLSAIQTDDVELLKYGFELVRKSIGKDQR